MRTSVYTKMNNITCVHVTHKIGPLVSESMVFPLSIVHPFLLCFIIRGNLVLIL